MIPQRLFCSQKAGVKCSYLSFLVYKTFFRLEMLNFCSELKMVLDKENYLKLARKLEEKNFQRIKNTLTILLKATRYIYIGIISDHNVIYFKITTQQ